MEPVNRNVRMTRRLGGVAAALIVILTAACDNVSWGGADVAVVQPPPKASPEAVVEAGESTDEAGVEPLPDGPILYYVARTNAGAYMTPVAQLSGDSLAPIRATGDAQTYGGRFIAEFMREGSEFLLFTRGRRAGTFIVQTAGLPEATSCPLLPVASGVLELSSAVQATEFLAMARADAPTVGGRGEAPELPGRIRIVGPILAERMLRARSAELPGNWQAAMRQATALPLGDSPNPAFTATFLVGDTLGPGLDDTGYSLFFIGVPTPSQTGYDTAFVSFRSYPETGKAAPRVIDYLDWSRDGSPDLLLQVYGVNGAWFEAVSATRDGRWRQVFSDRCEQGGRLIRPVAPAAEP